MPSRRRGGLAYRPARAGSPGVRVDGASGAQTVTTPLSELLEGQDQWREAVEGMGITVPDGWEVRLVEMRYDQAAWHRDAPGEAAVTRPAWRYKFVVESAVARLNMDDLVERVQTARARVYKQTTIEDAPAFLVAIGDTQFGKVDGDGVEGTVERVLRSTEEVVVRLKNLRRVSPIGDVYITWLGDCIEGFVSQGGGPGARHAVHRGRHAAAHGSLPPPAGWSSPAQRHGSRSRQWKPSRRGGAI